MKIANDITELVTKPLLLLQHNWYKMQEYNQNELLSLSREIMGGSFHKLTFQYIPKSEDAGAALNFHLSTQEKLNIAGALQSINNQQAFNHFLRICNGELTKP